MLDACVIKYEGYCQSGKGFLLYGNKFRDHLSSKQVSLSLVHKEMFYCHNVYINMSVYHLIVHVQCIGN